MFKPVAEVEVNGQWTRLGEIPLGDAATTIGFAPVTVSVPANLEITIAMKAENWAFGEVAGKPRAADAASLSALAER